MVFNKELSTFHESKPIIFSLIFNSSWVILECTNQTHTHTPLTKKFFNLPPNYHTSKTIF